MNAPAPRLTALATGGGCGCKLSPAALRDLLSGLPAHGPFPDLLVGTETGDDAAAVRVRNDLAVISTTDFFTPIVDDPRDFGRIAAANALSDVYAMGGRPVMALAILGMPLGAIPPAAVGEILAGGAEVCAEAGIPVAGGHSIDCPVPVYGLAVTGVADPARLVRNSGARAGDLLVLTKPLGIGVIGAAIGREAMAGEERDRLYRALVDTATRRNAIGPDLAALDGVHAMTDVTGFGLAGHALEMCRGAGLAAQIVSDEVPLIEGVAGLAQAGVRTGAAARNRASYCAETTGLDGWFGDLLCDPQTSGGLLVAVAPEAAGRALAVAREGGFAQAAVVGAMTLGRPGLVIA